MESIIKNNYGRLFKRRWVTVLVITLIFVLFSLVITVLQPFQYESEVKMLVIQKSAVNIDAYSASKSAERIGNNLSQIVFSSSFYNKVINSGFQIDKSYFPTQEEKKRKVWQKMIDSQVPTGTTILNIAVYHEEREQATIIAQAISYVLAKDIQDYIGISDVDLKVVDAPLTSKYPVKPNFLLNIILGFIIGVFISLAYLIITYTEDDEADEMFAKRHELKKEHKENKRQKKLARKEEKKKMKAEKKKLKTVVDSESTEIQEDSNGLTEIVDEEGEAESDIRVEKEEDDYKNTLPNFDDEDKIKTIHS